MRHNCPNCGAPVYLDRRSCPYCDTPYTIGLISDIRNDPDLETIRWAFRDGLITANEARDFLGLASIPLSVLYANDKPIAYFLPHFDVDYNLRLEMIR